MSNISAQLVKELRERSGAGMMECKKALVENHGDIEIAMEWLRKSGLAKADKKAGRVAAEGRIVAAQAGGKAVLVEVNCETDFVTKNPDFVKFSDTVADVALKSGAADIDTLKAAAYPGASNVEEAANALVGNPEHTAALEFTLVGPELRFLHDTIIAIGGAEFSGPPRWQPLRIGAGAVLRFGHARSGCRGYLAIAGGIDVAPVLGSR